MIIDKEYLNNKGLSQSTLKKILIAPLLFLKRIQEQEGLEVPDEGEPSENIMMGDACDLILTQGENTFYDQFVITNLIKPTGQVGDYAWNLFITGNEELAYQKTGAKISLDTLKIKFEKDGKEYYEFLCNNRDKKVLTVEQFAKVQGVIDSLRYNEFVQKYFTILTDSSGGGLPAWENFYQVELNFEYDREKCKGLMDLIHVDHINKKIHPIDLKVTESGTDAWEWIFWKMGYFFQASFYTQGIGSALCIQDYIRQGYTIELFSFVVESFKYPGSPIEYICTQELIDLGQFGGKKGNREYQGFAEAIKRFKWHTATGIWHYAMDVYKNNGKKWLQI